VNVAALHAEAMEHLEKARNIMLKLTGITPDWTARVQVRQSLEYLEDECREFGRHQLGLQVHKR
jgi:hypothetical protein